MTRVHAAWLEHQHKRFMRPDAHRYWKPGFRDAIIFKRVNPPDVHPPSAQAETPIVDVAAYRTALLDLRTEVAELKWLLALRRFARKALHPHHSQFQPRVPAGNSDGGQWTDGHGGGQSDPRVLSDATPDDDWKPGAQYAQNRVVGTPIRVNGVWRAIEQTPARLRIGLMSFPALASFRVFLLASRFQREVQNAISTTMRFSEIIGIFRHGAVILAEHLKREPLQVRRCLTISLQPLSIRLASHNKYSRIVFPAVSAKAVLCALLCGGGDLAACKKN